MDISNIVFGPAAGMIKTYEQALPLVGAACTRVTVGSITIEPRVGNLGDTYHFDPDTNTSHNSLGLPNPGMKAVSTRLPELKKKLNDHGQELAVSIAGFSPQEYAILAGALYPLVDRVEINLGCPNIWSRDGQKPIPSYHPEILGRILRQIRRYTGVGRNISAKISPVEDEGLLIQIFGQLVESGCIDEIVGVNTFPNQGAMRPDGQHALSFRASEDTPVQHVGGKAGAPLKEHGLRVLRLFQQWERQNGMPSIGFIGVGGIFTAHDAKDYLDAGADGFEVGTAYCEYGPRIFEEIALGLADI